MSGLTKDQLQRMEENRKKALARRAAILAAAGNSNNNQPAKPNNSQPMAGSGAAKPSSSAATQPYNRQISPTGNLSKPGGQQSTFSQNTYPKSGPPGQSSQPFSNQNSVPGKSASNFYKTGQTNINNNTQLGKSSATSSSFSNSIQSKAQSQPPGNTSKQTGDGKQLKIYYFMAFHIPNPLGRMNSFDNLAVSILMKFFFDLLQLLFSLC